MRVKKYITVFWALVLFWLFTGAGTIMAQDKMYMRMADSEMKRFPEAWQIDWAKRPVFGYCQGVVTLAMLKVWKQTKDEKYYKYVEEYADKMVKVLGLLLLLSVVSAAWAQERQDTIVVSRDGTGNFRTLQEAIESARAFMDYTVTIYVKNGVYKEKVIVPSWVENIDIIGEDRDKTIITYDDHANINKMGTFRTYTVKVEGSDITFKNLTIENNAAQLGQAVALHTEGDRLKFINCRILGNQDTIYTGAKFTRLYFKDCYIDGTTDFIFGPSTALFEDCIIHSKRNSYVTAASTPKEAKYGYVFKHCKLTAEPGVDKVYLGRPWRPYAYTLFIECELGKHIVFAGWHNWGKQSNEETARYMEYKNTGEGANASERVAWSKQLTKKEAEAVTVDAIFRTQSDWNPID